MFSGIIALLLQCIVFPLRISTGSFPKPLSAKEEREYLKRCREGDLEARNLLIEHNLRLVAHVIKKYYTATGDQDDLISIGTIGLIKGINTFRESKGTRLATYAARCIENEILMHFRAQKKQASEVSLSETIETDKEGNGLALMDIISADNSEMEHVDLLDTEQKLRHLVRDVLDPREREIIILRYGLGDVDPLTQREIAQKCNISRSYVSRIEKKALLKLREELEKPGK
ncbi:MAG: sigma-70 family RNA polymerase sigma factor [Ruminococcaceae bacterium]|nr:sigma-70 family RNA polymerase sigma factor [Oscillospiraceae bacterium]